MTERTLDEFDDSFDREPVAYAFELCRFGGPNGDRKIGSWNLHIQEGEPDESNWMQEEGKFHRIRNVRALVYGNETDEEEIVGYEFEFMNHADEKVRSLTLGDPRGHDDVVRYRPLVPK